MDLSRDFDAIALRPARLGKGLLLPLLTSAVCVIWGETIVWGNAFYLKNKSSENFPNAPPPLLLLFFPHTSKIKVNTQLIP